MKRFIVRLRNPQVAFAVRSSLTEKWTFDFEVQAVSDVAGTGYDILVNGANRNQVVQMTAFAQGYDEACRQATR